MLQKFLHKLSSNASQAAIWLHNTTSKITNLFSHQVIKLINNQVSANDDIYKKNTLDTTKQHKSSVEKILQTQTNIKDSGNNDIVLSWFTWQRILTYKKNKFLLEIEDWKIINGYKIINKRKIQIKATTIRQITALLQKKYKQDTKVSYTVKRNKNVKSNNNVFNQKIHWGYTYTNSSKTQFSLIVNKWEIIQAKYKNTDISISNEEKNIIQSSLNTSTVWLSNHISARRIKKQLKKIKNTTTDKNNKSNEVRTSKTNNDKVKLKQEKEKYKEQKTLHLQEDYKILSRYQFTLSKCNSQWSMINWSENIAIVVLKTLAARKWITLHNFDAFLSTKNKFEVFKNLIKEYLIIDKSYSLKAQEYRDSLYNIFISASEIYSIYLSKKNRNSWHNSRKKYSHIYEYQTYRQDSYYEDIKNKKDEWVKKYYWDKNAA